MSQEYIRLANGQFIPASIAQQFAQPAPVAGTPSLPQLGFNGAGMGVGIPSFNTAQLAYLSLLGSQPAQPPAFGFPAQMPQPQQVAEKPARRQRSRPAKAATGLSDFRRLRAQAAEAGLRVVDSSGRDLKKKDLEALLATPSAHQARPEAPRVEPARSAVTQAAVPVQLPTPQPVQSTAAPAASASPEDSFVLAGAGTRSQ